MTLLADWKATIVTPQVLLHIPHPSETFASKVYGPLTWPRMSKKNAPGVPKRAVPCSLIERQILHGNYPSQLVFAPFCVPSPPSARFGTTGDGLENSVR